MTKEGSLGRMYKEWTLVGALTASALPAAIYALQNSLLQISYKNLDSLTFSILNQTKIFFTALFTYFMLRYAPAITDVSIFSINCKGPFVQICLSGDIKLLSMCHVNGFIH